MNLYLTHKCNRGCAFCFARKIVSEGGVDINEILTIEDIEKLLQHYQKDLGVVGLLGGEPFLYPYLGELLQLLDKYNVIPKVFTSATNPMPQALCELDLDTSPIQFIVNVGKRDSYNNESYSNLINFLEKFHSRVALSYTALNLDDDYSFLFELIEEHKLQRAIRSGVALPIYKGGNQFVKKENYKDFGDFFIKFVKDAAKRKIIVGMDCGFVPCMFSIKQIGTLQRCGVQPLFCCGAAVDVGPRLETWNCFPLFQLSHVNALDYPDMESLTLGLVHKMEEDLGGKPGIFEHCQECEYFKNRLCNGGCKSFKSF
ncbi:MAG: radical SAM protein [Bacteroidales bacterium]|nr:radical SAM protein [Bacteroidales bacterium]